MSLLPKFFLLVALIVQVFSAEAESTHSHIAKHSAMVKQQLKSFINPSAMVPMSPAPYPESNNATGYVYLTNSYNSDCSAPFLSYGVPVGQCIVESNYAYKYNVVQDSCDGGVISYYLDTECTIRTGNTDLETFTNNCTRAENPKIDDSSMPIYMFFACTNSTEVPRTSDAGAVIVTTYEDTETCNEKSSHEYIAFNNDLCITIDDFSFTAACSHGEPIFNDFVVPLSNCMGAVNTSVLPTTCMIDPDIEDIDDDGLYVPSFLNPPPTISTTAFPTPVYVPTNGSQIFSCQESLIPSAEPTQAPTSPTVAPSTEPTAEPTLQPSTAPTVQPSTAPTVQPSTKPTVHRTQYPTAAAPAVATFYASQVFNGISYTTYSSNVALYSSTLIQTIAASMINVPISAITGFTVSATAPEPHGHLFSFNFAVKENNVRRAGQASLSLRRLQGDAIYSTYTVTLQSVYTAAQLSAQLENAISTGAFDNTLHTLATTNSATALTTVNSGELLVTYPTATDNDNGSSDKLSDGAIAGIVIGCVAGVVIIAALVYYFACSGKHGLLSNQPHLEL